MTEHPTDATWLTIECERVLYVDEGREKVLCDRLPSPVTLVVKPARTSQDTVGHAWERSLRERLTAAESEGRTMVPITTLELRGLIAARTTPIDDALVVQIADYLDECARGAIIEGDAFNLGVQRGLEIAAAQVRYGHALAPKESGE